jgi:O-antigen/teichoic acid export membrane protein
VAGSALSQLLPVMSLPLLSIYYQPASFASLSVFMALGAVISIASTGRYELAIVHPKEEKGALDIFFLCCLSSLLISGFIGLTIIGFDQFGGNQLFETNFSLDFLFLIPFSILGYSLMQVLNYWYTRKGQFVTVSLLRVSQSILFIGFAFLFGWWGWKSMGLVYAFSFGGGFILAVTLYLLYRKRSFFSWKDLKTQAAQYRHYPQHLMTTAFMDTAAVQAPIFFLAASFDPIVVGSYGFANRIVMAPVTLISASIGQVYYQQIARADRLPSDIIRTFRRTFIVLAILAILLFGGLFFLGEYLVGLFFAAEWQEAGSILSILSLALLIRFVVSPLSLTLVVLNRFSWVSLWQTTYLVSTVTFFLFCPTFGFKKMLYFFVVHESIHYCFYLLIIYYALKKRTEAGLFKSN